jgi:hypothetical protein
MVYERRLAQDKIDLRFVNTRILNSESGSEELERWLLRRRLILLSIKLNTKKISEEKGKL